jgi:hypothetical protein
MEGETKETIETQSKIFHDRILPTLDNNIKSGNSLIDLDYYDGQLEFSGEERKIKPFSWQKNFPEIFKQGGFDCVIGNPPYVNLVAIPEEQRIYFQNKYKTCKNKSDLYSFFIEKSCSLVKENGKFGFIVPHTWLATDSFELLRKKMLLESRIEEIVEMGFKVFEKVIVSTVIVLSSNNNETITVRNKDFSKRFSIPTKKWIEDNYHIDLEWNPAKENIYKKLTINTTKLENILQFSRGIKTSDDKRFLTMIKNNEDCKPVYRGRNIKAYSLNWASEYIWYRPDLMKEKVGSLPHNKAFFEVSEKLITQRVNSSMQLLVAYDNEQNYFLDTTNVSRMETWDKKHSLKYILALLNSKLINFWYSNKYKMPTIGLYELHSIPFREIDFNNKSELTKYNEIIKHVDQLLQLNRDLQTATLPNQKEQIQGRISYCEDRINAMVYELYGLTGEEIGIIEK